MAEAAAVQPISGQQQQRVNFGLVSGRIESVRRFEGTYYTRVKLPAADTYQHPQIVEVASETRLGDPEAVIKVQVTIGGYSRSFMATDPETNGRKKVSKVEVVLRAVE